MTARYSQKTPETSHVGCECKRSILQRVSQAGVPINTCAPKGDESKADIDEWRSLTGKMCLWPGFSCT